MLVRLVVSLVVVSLIVLGCCAGKLVPESGVYDTRMIRKAKHFGSYTAAFITGIIQKQRCAWALINILGSKKWTVL